MQNQTTLDVIMHIVRTIIIHPKCTEANVGAKMVGYFSPALKLLNFRRR